MMATSRPAPQWLIILAFLAIYIVWGTTYLAIIYGLKGFPPFMLSSLRYIIAGVLLLGWCLFKRQQWPGWATVRTSVVSGLLMLIGGSGLVTWAEQYVSSGQAAIIIATEPFLFLLADRKRWNEYFSSRFILCGLLTGFTGIVIFFTSSTGFTTADTISPFMHWVGYAVILFSTTLWVGGSLYGESRRDKDVPNFVITCIQLLAAGLCCVLISGATGEWKGFSFSAVPLVSWAGLFYLVIFGSLMAYMAFTWLITVRPPALVSTHTYVNPLVAVLMGWALAGEQFSIFQIGAMIVILVGVLLTNFPSYKLSLNKQRS